MTILSKSNVIAFVPSTNLNDSRLFYESKLGLVLHHADEVALEFKIGKVILRITKVNELVPAIYTLFGWEVDDIEATIRVLTAQGVKFVIFNGLSQNELGICTFSDGGKVAWFKDLDGNTLSITQLVK